MSQLVCLSNWNVSTDKSSEYSVMNILHILHFSFLVFFSNQNQVTRSLRDWPSCNETAIFNENRFEIKDKRMTSWDCTPLQMFCSLQNWQCYQNYLIYVCLSVATAAIYMRKYFKYSSKFCCCLHLRQSDQIAFLTVGRNSHCVQNWINYAPCKCASSKSYSLL